MAVRIPDRSSVYRSETDVWLFPGILIVPTATLGVLTRIAVDSWEGAWIGAVLGLSLLLALIAITWRLHYILTGDDLIIKSGTFELVVPLIAIKGVEPVNAFTPAICLSSKRVLIRLWHRTIVISPENREDFIAELSARQAARNTTLVGEFHHRS